LHGIQLAGADLFSGNPQTYPQIFVDIAESTTAHRWRATLATFLVQRRNLPPRESLA